MVRDVNGVFEGGGAKGVAYVGALQACEEAGLRFRAVAGSSAGAITAALVACGCDAATIDGLTGQALRRLGTPGRALVRVRRRSLLSSGALRDWLRATLIERLHENRGRPVSADPTFAEVYGATGVSLYVVTMDLASRQPLVFSPKLTPSASVADAVVASSAIPVAFPATRVLIDGEIHRLADGGVWANYPTFVFLDDDFRRSHDLDPDEAQRPTLGFILDPPGGAARQHPQAALLAVSAVSGVPLLTDRGAAARELGIVGGLITSPVAKITAVALPFVVTALGVGWFLREVDDEFPTVRHLRPDSLQYVALIVALVAFAFLVGLLAAVALVVVRLGRALFDEGVVGASAAMGVGPGVPAWIGAHPTPVALDGRAHVPVRIPVPKELTTLAFGIDDELRSEAKRSAHAATVASLRAHDIADIAGPPSPTTTAAPARPPTRPQRVRGVIGMALSGVALLAALWMCAWLSRQVLQAAWEGWVPWWQLLLLLVGGGVVVTLHGWRRNRRATAARSFLVRRRPLVLVTIALASLAVALAALVAFLPSSGELTIIERITSERVQARVLGEPRTVGDEGPFNGIIDVASPDLAGLDSFEQREHDACEAATATDACFAVNTDPSAWSDIDPAATVELHYVADRDLVLPRSELWAYSLTDITQQVLTLPFLVLPYRCLLAYRHQRQRTRVEQPGSATPTTAPTPVLWAAPEPPQKITAP